MIGIVHACLRFAVEVVRNRVGSPVLHRGFNGMGFHKYLDLLKESGIKCSGSQSVLRVVLGNESCDLDSAVCALVTGYYLTETVGSLSVPMLSIPRCDYCLKTEVRCLLEELGINAESLFFLDDIDLSDLRRKNLLELTLVDHNVLPKSLASLESAVVRVIDHHKWERGGASDCLEKVWGMTGSCATLVGERILSTKREIIDATVARLLQSAIVLDTVNFSDKAKKTTPQDTAVFGELRSGYTPDVDWDAEFSKLKRAREDISALSVCGLLKKDLKIVRERISIAIPSVPADLDEFLAMPSVYEELESFRKLENVDAIVVMISKCYDNELKRWLVIFGSDARRVETISHKLETFRNPSLETKSIEVPKALSAPSTFSILAFEQNNVACSRKTVLPILKELAADHTAAWRDCRDD